MALVCIILLAGLLVVLRLEVPDQPINAHLARLYFDECQLPCWIGIDPGKTHLLDAKRKIFSHFPNPKLEAENIYLYRVEIQDAPEGLFSVTLEISSGEVIGNIELYFTPPTAYAMRAGDIYMLTGEPSHFVAPVSAIGNVWPEYGFVFDKPDSKIYLFAFPEENRPMWTAAIKELYLSRVALPLDMFGREILPWKGQQTFERYSCFSQARNLLNSQFCS